MAPSRTILALLLLCLHGSSSLKVLIYSAVVAKSHVATLSALVNTLTAHGHSVDVVMAQMNHVIKDTGKHNASRVIVVDFPSGKSPWNEKAAHLADPFLDTTPLDPFHSLFLTHVDVSQMMCAHVLNSVSVRDLLSSSFDVALSTGYDFCGFGLLHAFSISPVLSYSTMGLFQFQSMIGGYPELPLYENMPLDSRPHTDISSFSTRLLSTLRSFVDHWRLDRRAESANSLFRARFGPSFPDVRLLARETSFDLINAHPLLDEPRPISSKVKFIGGLGMTAPKPLNEFYEGILSKAKRGTVIFSFGTQVPSENITPKLVNIFRQAFKAYPEYTFLWKLDGGKTKFAEDNIHNVDWLPQTDLLYSGKISAFISHMGMNSFTEASVAGVPLLCIPLFADQFHNARRAEKLGTGITLEKTRLGVEGVTEALGRILNNTSYGERARRLGAVLRANPDTSTRVLLEAVALASSHGDIAQFSILEGAFHSFAQRHAFDVIAFISVSLCLLIIIALYLLFTFLGKVILDKSVKRKRD